jgi:hypothetical protein
MLVSEELDVAVLSPDDDREFDPAARVGDEPAA